MPNSWPTREALERWATIAQVWATPVTAIGVLASVIFSSIALWSSSRESEIRQGQFQETLEELQLDRRSQHAPLLRMLPEAFYLDIANLQKNGNWPHGLDSGRQIPIGLDQPSPDPNGTRGDNLLVTGTQRTFGTVTNFGTGPAYSITIDWIPLTIERDGETTGIPDTDDFKWFRTGNNTTSIYPSDLLPTEHAGCDYLPAFINKDLDNDIRERAKVTKEGLTGRDVHFQTTSTVHGELTIHCSDVFGTEHSWTQSFDLEVLGMNYDTSARLRIGPFRLPKGSRLK